MLVSIGVGTIVVNSPYSKRLCGLLLLFFVPRGALLRSHRYYITAQGSEFIIKAVLALLNWSLGMQHPYSKAVVNRVHLNMNPGKCIYICFMHKFSISFDVISFLSSGKVKNIWWCNLKREFCAALGTAVKQVNPNAGTVLSALEVFFALSFIAGQLLLCSSGDCLSDSFHA